MGRTERTQRLKVAQHPWHRGSFLIGSVNIGFTTIVGKGEVHEKCKDDAVEMGIGPGRCRTAVWYRQGQLAETHSWNIAQQ